MDNEERETEMNRRRNWEASPEGIREFLSGRKELENRKEDDKMSEI